MRLVIVSNRVKLPESLQAGGMAVGIEAAMAGREGLWIGWSGRFETPDRPPVEERRAGEIAFAVADLPEATFKGYYNGFSNQVLWPLLHDRPDLVVLDPDALSAYMDVNARLAALVAARLAADDLVWIHDYHLVPLAALLRARGVRNRIGFFLHTPFADPQTLGGQPFAERFAGWLRAYDVIGLQTPLDASAARRFLAVHPPERWSPPDAEPDIHADPIGIDTTGFARMAADAAVTDGALSAALATIGDTPFAIAIDRIDYSKAIPERIEAFTAFRTRRPDTPAALLQVAVPSRTEIPAYREEDARIARAAAAFARAVPGGEGLHLVRSTVDRPSLAAACRRARVGLVTPRRDGMNLVAKEYLAAQNPDDPGVLILSPGAGSADTLDVAALLASPDDEETVIAALERAFAMNPAERRRRFEAVMPVLEAHDATRWACTFVDRLAARPIRRVGATPRRWRVPASPRAAERTPLPADA